jgi:hypothetical protein
MESSSTPSSTASETHADVCNMYQGPDPTNKPDTTTEHSTLIADNSTTFEQPPPASNQLNEALRPADNSGTSASTETGHNDGDKPGPHEDPRTNDAVDDEQKRVDTDKPTEASNKTEGLESVEFENISNDVESSLLKLGWKKVYLLTYEERKKKGNVWLKHAVCHEILMNDRIDAIGKVLTTRGFMSTEEKSDSEKFDSEKSDSNKSHSQKTHLRSGTLQPVRLGWYAFTSCKIDKLEPMCFALLLVERPIRSVSERALVATERSIMSAPKVFGGNDRVERIQFPTPAASYLFDDIMGFGVPDRHEAILRPFKPLLACYNELQTRYMDKAKPAVVEDGKATDDSVETAPASVPRAGESASMPTQGGSLDDDDEEEAREHNKLVTAQAILHLISNDLKDDLKIHLDCCERRKSVLHFDDAWHLLFPGDTVYDPKLDRAYKVLCVQNGLNILDLYADQADGNPQMHDAKNPLTILAFSIDFDGQIFGPAQHFYTIDPWEGEQKITSLPIYPIEYASADSSEPSSASNTKKEALQARGCKFCDIVNSPQVAHRQYRGPEVGKVRGQVS